MWQKLCFLKAKFKFILLPGNMPCVNLCVSLFRFLGHSHTLYMLLIVISWRWEMKFSFRYVRERELLGMK